MNREMCLPIFSVPTSRNARRNSTTGVAHPTCNIVASRELRSCHPGLQCKDVHPQSLIKPAIYFFCDSMILEWISKLFINGVMMLIGQESHE